MGELVVQGLVQEFVQVLHRIAALSEYEGDDFFEKLNDHLSVDKTAADGIMQIEEFLQQDEEDE